MPSSRSSQTSALMRVQTTRLANGIRVVSSHLPHVRSVAAGIWSSVGSRYESDAVSGISHFVEHLMFKGTRRRSARDISMAIEGRGGYLNAFTSEECTCYYVRVGQRQLRPALTVLADMFQGSVMAREEIEKERSVIMEEILMYQDQPRHLVHEMLGGILWPEHPVGRPIIGSPETVQSLKRRELLDFVKNNYTGRNTVVAFAGNIDHADCVALVESLFARLPAGGKGLRCKPVTSAVRQVRTAFLSRQMEQTQLAMGIRLFGYESEDRHALRLLNAILGENMSSRLFQIVREQHGLAYSVHSHIQLFRDSGALTVSAGLDRTRKEKALTLIIRELARLKEKPVSRAELKRARDYVVGQLHLGLESTMHHMMWVGDNMITRNRLIAPEDVVEKINAVTAEDILKLSRRIFRKSRVSLAVVSPEFSRAEQAALRRCLTLL